MGRVRYTYEAREDLLDIWLRIAEVNAPAADRIVDKIEDACGRLRSYPQLGRARPDIAEGARVLVVEEWLAFYRHVGSDTQVVRVVDGRRDVEQLYGPV